MRYPSLRSVRFKRCIFSLPSGILVFLGLLLASIKLAYDSLQTKVQPGDVKNYIQVLLLWTLSGLVLGAAFLALQYWMEYRKRTYDPTWIFKYQEIFEEKKAERKSAAQTLLRYHGRLSQIAELGTELSPIDDVLDLLEDLGFYVYGDQISPEVAHHHFYHWIRGYWEASRQYLKAYQVNEPPAWQHLQGLYTITSSVEATKSKARGQRLELSEGELKYFLEEERDL